MYLTYPGVEPDVAIIDDVVHLVYGIQPWTWLTMTLDGKVLSTRLQPTGYFPRTNGVSSVSHDGRFYYHWNEGGSRMLPDSPWGNCPIDLSPSGVIAHQRWPDVVVGDGTLPNAARPTGIWEVHDDGSVVMMDQANHAEPWAGGYVHHSQNGRLIIAEGAEGGVVGQLDGRMILPLWPGEDCQMPRCAANSTHAAVVAWTGVGPKVKVWIGPLTDLVATSSLSDLEARVAALESTLQKIRLAVV